MVKPESFNGYAVVTKQGKWVGHYQQLVLIHRGLKSEAETLCDKKAGEYIVPVKVTIVEEAV